MFTTLLVIATIVAATLGAGVGYLRARPIINRLRAELANATWQLTHDPLTSLLNRAGLRTVHTAIASSGHPQPCIVMLIDLDKFKEVNDTHSHDVGDRLLVETANRLRQLAHTYGGYVARLSGDEFSAILPAHHQSTDDVADQFNSVLAAPIKVQTDSGPITVGVTASIGITTVASTELLEAVALHRADTAMYHAKQQGGDRHVVHTPGMTMPNREHRRGPRTRDQRGSVA